MAGLPDEAVARALRARELRDLGVRRRESYGPLWRAPYHGVRVWAGRSTDDTLTRIETTVPLLPEAGAIGGWAAACVAGVPGFDGITLDGKGQPIDHVIPPALHLDRRPGIRLRREQLDPSLIRHVGHVPLTEPARTAVDTARWAPGLVDAVAGLDAMLYAGFTSPAAVRATINGMHRRRGLPQARRALALSDPAARSPRETQLRLLWVEDAGHPHPRVNVPVFSTAGHFLGMPDLLDEEAGLALEYDGAHHRALGQHTDDNAREERLERAGLRVIRFTVLDLRNVDECVRRMQLERRRRLGRDRSLETWCLDPRRAA